MNNMNRDNDLYIQQLFKDAQLVQLSHAVNGTWASGTFSNEAKFREEVEKRQGKGSLYTTLNRPYERIPAQHRMHTKIAGTHEPLTNSDMEIITYIPFDFDPIRPKGTCSTSAELALAESCRDHLVRMLSEFGWKFPLKAISGNGAHALYRCRIENSDMWDRVSNGIYDGIEIILGNRLKELEVNFDTSVKNAGRLWRLYGTTNRKAKASDNRPQRVADCRIPSSGWNLVDIKAVLAFHCYLIDNGIIDEAKPNLRLVVDNTKPAASNGKAYGKGDYATLDVVTWFKSHGLYKEALKGQSHKHAVTCPWKGEHQSGNRFADSIIYEACNGGWPGFFCHHSHCQGRNIRDVMALLGDADAYCSAPFKGGKHG
jgi:hypothetical protein